MTKSRLVKQLTAILNGSIEQDYLGNLEALLIQVEHLGMTKDQKNKIDRLNGFITKYYDGEVDKIIVLQDLIIDVIVSMKDLPVQYRLKYWLNQMLVTNRTALPGQSPTALLHQARAALQAKMAWSIEANHSWTGNGDLPCYLSLEEQLVSMYGWLLQECYDHDDIDDLNTLNGMCYVALDSL